MEYQNLRGGHIVLADIQKPARHEWGSGLDAMQTALELEKEVNSSLIQLHKTAELHCDAQMQDFIESNFLKEQVEAINMLAGFISNLKRVGPGLGEYLFDKNSLGEDSSVH
ncbi:unnamed protein product [Protopolystoma xenopodis]|uniref:Ferritin n=1 Tax=Protopolystoma xenopodis TaxID=117903 RepID=A0A3S5B093_9PLAT|nr:unnamed protein product [Protopolystoma xenopodis]